VEGFDGLAQTLQNGDGLLGARIGQHHTELIATIARRRVAFAQMQRQAGADHSQYVVAYQVAMAVVDLLEVVDVEQRQVALGAVRLAAAELSQQHALPGPVVAQPGQAVGLAEMGQRTLVLGQLHGDLVADHADGHGVDQQDGQTGEHLCLGRLREQRRRV